MFAADVDNDGHKEKISVGLGERREIGNDIVVSVSDNEGFGEVTVNAGYFESANLAETPGGALCLVVSCSYENDFCTTYICSFDGTAPVPADNVNGRVTDVSFSNITVNDYVDALGTWPYSRLYNITDGFAFEPATDMMIDMADRGPLITKADIPVDMLTGGGYTPAKLDAGTAVYPEATDGSTFMLFRLDDGREGRISFTVANYECFINGVSEYDCFADVPYAG
jgi:hypothetical protein